MSFSKLKFKTGSWLLGLDKEKKNHSQSSLNGIDGDSYINSSTHSLNINDKTLRKHRGRTNSVSQSEISEDDKITSPLNSPPTINQETQLKIIELKDSLVKLNLENQKLSSKVSEMESGRTNFEAEIELFTLQIEELKSQLDDEKESLKKEAELRLKLESDKNSLSRREKEHSVSKEKLEATNKELADELAQIKQKLKETQRTSPHEPAQDNYYLICEERDQLKRWFEEEKIRHNQIRDEWLDAKSEIKRLNSKLREYEETCGNQTEQLKNLENRDASYSESILREVNYYRDQLDESIQAKEELKLELERSSDQIKVLRSTMEQLLKAGVGEGRAENSTNYSPMASPTSSRFNSLPRRERDFNYSASSQTKSVASSDDFEQVQLPSEPASHRHSNSQDRRRTFGYDQFLNNPISPQSKQFFTPPDSSTTAPTIISEPVEASSTELEPLPLDLETLDGLDLRLKQLMKEKEKVEAEYSRIPITKVNLNMRRRKERLEQQLDTLDSDISGVRLKIRGLKV